MKNQLHKHLLFAVILLVGCLLCACGESSSGSIVQQRRGTGKAFVQLEEAETEELMDEEEAKVDPISQLYLVGTIDTQSRTIELLSYVNGKSYSFSYQVQTQFLDKYGNHTSYESFHPGEVVEIDASFDTLELNEIKESDQVFRQSDVRSFSIDEEEQSIVVGQTKYRYSSRLRIFSGDDIISAKELIEGDEIWISGIDKEIVSIQVTKGHGELALSNTELFDGSFICVGSEIFKEVEPNMKIIVPEGTYLVTVANQGYGGSREVLIKRNETTTLSLEELKGEGPKICRITFLVSVDDAVLKIDGKTTDFSNPVEVTYGVHTISVGAEGYDEVSEKLVVNSKEAEIEIGLTASKEEPTNTPVSAAPATENNNNSSNNSNDNSNNNTDSSTNTGNNSDSSQTDYLTTLYNLLTSSGSDDSDEEGSVVTDLNTLVDQ